MPASSFLLLPHELRSAIADRHMTTASIAANKARIPLAKMAVEETGMGVVEDKIIKNHYAAEYILSLIHI